MNDIQIKFVKQEKFDFYFDPKFILPADPASKALFIIEQEMLHKDFLHQKFISDIISCSPKTKNLYNITEPSLTRRLKKPYNNMHLYVSSLNTLNDKTTTMSSRK